MKLGSYTLQPHQKKAVDQLMTSHTKGLILYFATGSGKSLTSIAAAEALMAGDPKLSVVVVAPASLVINFQNELHKYDVNPKPYTLFSLQGFVKEYDFRGRDADKVKKLNNRILIVDEAHNLKNASSTISKVVVAAAASAYKVIALSGTPIQNRPCEIAPLLCMIKPHCVPITQNSFQERFGLSGLSSHMEQLQKALHCTISHYKPLLEDSNYPTLSIREVLVLMDPVQVKAHLQAVRHLPVVDFEDLAKSDNLMAFLNAPRRIANGTKFEGNMYCSKINEVVRRVVKGVRENQKSIVYSSFLEYGADIVKSLLTKHNIQYALITGEQNAQAKEKARVAYNNREVMVLVFSKAGSQGITLYDTAYVHVIEPDWHSGNADQVIGRSRRWKSHSGRYGNHVTVYRYISTMPPPSSFFSKAKRFVRQIGVVSPLETMTADQVLLELTARKDKIIKEFLSACIKWGQCSKQESPARRFAKTL